MLLYPNAKINIGLNITEKLKSGYHNIESCFCPVSLFDIIEIKESVTSEIIETGIPIKCKEEDNLILKVLNNLPQRKNYKIHLHKNIPIGSGLGGGSSDSAIFLKYLNAENGSKLSKKNLYSIANRIGSDCPFFIDNKIKYVTGTGNILDKINIDMNNKYIIIYCPNEKISTAEAYNTIKPKKGNYNLKEVLENENLENWDKYVKNDFEPFAMKKIKSLKKIKNNFIERGAKFVSLSGSGSSIFGIFDRIDSAEYFAGMKNIYFTEVIN